MLLLLKGIQTTTIETYFISNLPSIALEIAREMKHVIKTTNVYFMTEDIMNKRCELLDRPGSITTRNNKVLFFFFSSTFLLLI